MTATPLDPGVPGGRSGGRGRHAPRARRRVVLFAGLLLAGAGAALVWRDRSTPDPDSAERLGAPVEMLCRESGRRFRLTRGLVEAELRGRVGQLREDDGVASPYADDRPVARMASEAQWRETIERINREKRGG
ncbi:MAG: hypothetical protein IT439_03395 [Phycisphaerales bacterium]|nr:hypothetical protein [Phycisphaerales bacterium]